MSSEGSSPPSHSDKVMALLEEKVKEREEMIRSLSEKMNFLEKGSVDKTSEIDFLKKSIDDKASTIKVLQETLQAKDQEIAGIKEKHETEMSEKEMKLSSQIKSNEELQKMVASLKDSLSELESKEKVTERLLLLDAEKEQQFRDEKQAFHDSEKALHGQLQVSLDHNRRLEQQGRDNEEKVMHELAVKIRAAEGFQLKLEETKQLLEDRNKTVEGLMDRLDAQKRLIETRDQVIDQLKAMKNLDSGADELVGTLREQIEAMNARVEKSVDEARRAKREISALKKELEEKSELIASAEKVRTIFTENIVRMKLHRSIGQAVITQNTNLKSHERSEQVRFLILHQQV